MSVFKYILLFVAISNACFSIVDSKNDSLEILLNKCKDDKCRLSLLIELSKNKVFSQSAEAIDLSAKASELALKTNENDLIAEAFINEAYVHRHVGNYETAIEKYFSCIKYAEKAKNLRFVGYANAQLGIIYMLQKDFKTGLEKLLIAENLVKKSPDNWAKGKLYEAIGNCYLELKDPVNSEINYKISEEFFIKSGEFIGTAQMLANRAEYYMQTNDLKSAEVKLNECLIYSQKANSNNSWFLYYMAKGRFELLKGQNIQAKNSFETAMSYAGKYPSNEAKHSSFEGLYKAYESLNDYKNALKYYILKTTYADSLDNKELVKNLTKAQANYEYSKKHLMDSLNHEKENTIKNIEIKEKDEKLKGEKQFRFLLYLILVMLLGFAGFVFKSYVDKNRTNKIILAQKSEVESQKHVIQEKQKEIIDSINYAQRIQSAILASENEIKKYFPESFLLFQPKDIVAGDFYFFERNETHVFYAAADCTGHGVPGALVSVVCSNALTRCVKEFNLTDTGMILDKTRELVLDTFRKSGQEVKDGMDISLIAKELKTNMYSWSGANNPLWYVINNELFEIKANKQPIGLHTDPKPYTTHVLNVNSGDVLYLFTDGYADQFGGPKGKKFKYKQLEEVLLHSAHLTLAEQKQNLESTFVNWKGKLEQVDDVTIIGIRC